LLECGSLAGMGSQCSCFCLPRQSSFFLCRRQWAGCFTQLLVWSTMSFLHDGILHLFYCVCVCISVCKLSVREDSEQHSTQRNLLLLFCARSAERLFLLTSNAAIVSPGLTAHCFGGCVASNSRPDLIGSLVPIT
jgi:hypothetical protein